MNIAAAVLGTVGTESPYAESKPLVVEKLLLDAPGPGEVLVRIKAAGLCHSDVGILEDEIGVGPAEFEHAFLENPAGRRGDALAGGDAPGERHGGDMIVLDQRLHLAAGE